MNEYVPRLADRFRYRGEVLALGARGPCKYWMAKGIPGRLGSPGWTPAFGPGLAAHRRGAELHRLRAGGADLLEFISLMIEPRGDVSRECNW
jgi:hypothetical protein